MRNSTTWARRPRFAVVTAAALVLGIAGGAHADPHGDANAADARGDYQAELKILQPEAARGQAWAQNNLGSLYLFGNGVPHDDAQALALFQKAAAQGDPGGEVNLGQMYEGGLGVAQDDNRAASLYRSAAEQNRPRAWTILKRLCDHARASPPADCARIPPGTESAPDLDLNGKPGVISSLLWALFRLAVGVAVIVFAVKRMRDRSKAKQADGTRAPAIVGGGPATVEPSGNALARDFLIFVVIGSFACVLLILAPLLWFAIQNPDQPGVPALGWLWVMAVAGPWMTIVAVRARRLRKARAETQRALAP